VRFSPDLVAGLDEPVRRFLRHAIRDGAPIGRPVRLSMQGRIRVGLWLPFTAQQTIDGASFAWRARVGRGRLAPLQVTDAYACGTGSTEGRLLGRKRVFGARDADTTRSAAGRLALESVVFAPHCVLPSAGVAWRAEDDHVIVASLHVPPERPEVRVLIDDRGGVRSVSALRWGDAGGGRHEYLPCGGDVLAEGRFGDLVLPSRLRVGWRVGTPRFRPFFEAGIQEAVPA
jgi:hypothetical protein